MLDADKISDIDDGSGVSVEAIYDSIKSDMESEGYNTLINLGDAKYEAGNYQEAIEEYDRSLAIKPDNPAAIYKKALSYEKSGETDTANELFGEVIMNYPNSDYAAMAKAERGY